MKNIRLLGGALAPNRWCGYISERKGGENTGSARKNLNY
jgi:hypothetical protein